MKTPELKLCGMPAVRARFARDAASIQRLYFDAATSRKIGVMCRTLAASRKIYRCVEPAELERVAGTVHHGGIVAVVAAPVLRAPNAGEIHGWARSHAPLLLLDRIGNAHNLGAIARTAGYLGVSRMILPADPTAALPGEAAYRVAEGGLEAVEVFRVPDLASFGRELVTAGYELTGAATRGGRAKPSPRGRESQRARALVLGNEEHGLSPEVARVCTELVTIPGRGKVESLNVSVAAAILMWELFGR